MKQKRTKNQKREMIQQTLEGYRRFDFDYISYGHNWFAPDGNYPYRQNAINSMFTAVNRTLLQVLGPILLRLLYRARVKGRENLKELDGKGAICLCNHVSYLDTLFVREAVGHYRSYHTMAPFNNKKGIGGWFIRHGGLIPLGGNLAAVKNMEAELERLLQGGNIVNFYAEKAMWINYQKPRPLQNGAFHYAVKFGVPVLPIFCTFDKSKRGRMKNLVIHIMPPVYADDSLPRKERMVKLRADSEKAWRDCYESAYNTALCYVPDRRKNGR